ncbi:glycine-rich domain-containing protein [Crateriforma spongiae]|uniref:glycine-rich domain-containing protein n=1 Tax=Crateriforma spongiae TaxID=2724528 RepID=UPI001445A819|nr:hypothetical protein [Crateriforma spongiae]
MQRPVTTGPASESSPLWGRIREFSFDHGDEQLTFAARLARENGWSQVFANRAIQEYKRFIYLAVCSGHSVTPSDEVDQVWHLHLTYTRSYWHDWCRDTLGKEIHHGPTKGGRSEGEKFDQWYRRTKDSYREHFGEDPPSDLWPAPDVRFGPDTQCRRINTNRNWVLPKPTFMTGLRTGAGVALPAVAGGGLWLMLADENPFVEKNDSFSLATDGWILFVGFVLVVFALKTIGLVVFGGKKRRRGGRGGKSGGSSGCASDGGGGFFFGGDSSCGSDSGCSSGCGAGCGGGCGS